MPLTLLLLSLLPLLLMAEHCPTVLEGLPSKLDHLHEFEEIMDTACGRRNFTSLFWSTFFREHLIINIAFDSRFNETEEVPYDQFFHSLKEKFGDYAGFRHKRDIEFEGDEEFDNEAVKAFYHSLSERFQAMENVEARDYIQELTSIHRNFLNPENSLSFFRIVMQGFRLAYFYLSHRLSIDAQIALSHTLKEGFGMEGTTEMRRARIETAMRAIERTALSNERLDEFYGQLYLLAKEKSAHWILLTKQTTGFEEFAEWVQDDWNSTGIAPMEVIPAVETLYLQYRTLENREAKGFVDWILAVLTFTSSRRSAGDEVPEILKTVTKAVMEKEDELWDTCPSQNVRMCYHDLSTEAKSALAKAFPEFTQYLNQHGFAGKKMGSRNQAEIKTNHVIGSVTRTIRPLRREFMRTIFPKKTSFAEKMGKESEIFA